MCEAIEEMKRETAERVERETAERVERETAERETADHIGQLMKNLRLSATQAMDALGIPAERRAFYMAML